MTLKNKMNSEKILGAQHSQYIVCTIVTRKKGDKKELTNIAHNHCIVVIKNTKFTFPGIMGACYFNELFL